MLDANVLTLNTKNNKLLQAFFPRAENLTSQIEKNARKHAVIIVSSWAKSVYARKLRTHIWLLFKADEITEDFKHQLYIVGKCLVNKPSKNVSQDAINTYHSWLYDEEISGKLPGISDKAEMVLSEDTSTFRNPKHAWYADFWISVATLVPYHTVKLPLVGNPYIKLASQVGKGVLARKDKRGRWRFEAIDQKDWEIPVKNVEFDAYHLVSLNP